MYYVISDSEGSRIDSFRDRRLAERALLSMVREHPEDAGEMLLLAYEEDGTPAGPARLAEDVRQDLRMRAAAADAARLERARAGLIRIQVTSGSWIHGRDATITDLIRSHPAREVVSDGTDGHVEIPTSA